VEGSGGVRGRDEPTDSDLKLPNSEREEEGEEEEEVFSWLFCTRCQSEWRE